MLCKRCSNIHFTPIEECDKNLDRLLSAEAAEVGTRGILFYFHSKDLKCLEKSASLGCHFCVKLKFDLMTRTNFSEDMVFRETAMDEIWFSRFIIRGYRSLQAWHEYEPIWMHHRQRKYWIDCVKIFHEPIRSMLQALTTPSEALGPLDKPNAITMLLDDASTREVAGLNPQLFLPDADTSTCSTASLKLAYQWLKTCSTTHKWCGEYQGSGRPKRLINVANPRQPFLEDSYMATDCYITLSYRWGVDQYTSTKDNIKSHYSSIPFNELPRTIREAMLVTHELRVQYLWIDALCLIQDSQTDKEGEIPRMGDIYRGSILTLYAWAADNAEKGLASTRDPRLVKPCRLQIRATFEGKNLNGHIFAKSDIADAYASPMEARGWVLQEQHLAVRKLFFGARQLRWRCQCESNSESSPETEHVVPPDINNKTIEHWLHFRNNDYNRHYSWKKENQYDMWYKVVEDYTQRNLTCNTDVLPGLAGLAKTLANNHKTHYINGLWMEDIEAGLLWKIDQARKLERDLDKQVSLDAPSWTWVSQWGKPITFLSDYHDYHQFELTYNIKEQDDFEEYVSIAVNDYVNDYEALGLFQKVRKGGIRLEGPLMQALVCKEKFEHDSHQGLSIIIPHGKSWIQSIVEPKSGKVIGYIEPDESPQEMPVTDVTCILCYMSQEVSGNWRYTYLALEATNRRPNEYRRVGIVQATAEDAFFQPGYHFESLDPVAGDKCWRKSTIYLV